LKDWDVYAQICAEVEERQGDFVYQHELPEARLGVHQDRGVSSLDAPVVSISVLKIA
jgi:alkylated DNA repair dioxygenase AlkB